MAATATTTWQPPEGECLHFRDWEAHYEVNNKDNPQPGGSTATLRQGSLKYVRLRVAARDWTIGWRKFQRIARGRTAAAWGVFCKLLELAAANTAGRRGWVVTREGRPAGVADLVEELGLPARELAAAIPLLLTDSLGWLELAVFPASFFAEPGTSREVPGSPGPLRKTRQPKPKVKVNENAGARDASRERRRPTTGPERICQKFAAAVKPPEADNSQTKPWAIGKLLARQMREHGVGTLIDCIDDLAAWKTETGTADRFCPNLATFFALDGDDDDPKWFATYLPTKREDAK